METEAVKLAGRISGSAPEDFLSRSQRSVERIKKMSVTPGKEAAADNATPCTTATPCTNLKPVQLDLGKPVSGLEAPDTQLENSIIEEFTKATKPENFKSLL